MARITIDDVETLTTPKSMMQAIDTNFIEVYSNVESNTTDIATNTSKLLTIESGAEANNISDIDATDLTDGDDSTLHYHSSDRNRNNHTGSQLSSTISDFDTAVAANAAVAANTAKETNVTTDLSEGFSETTVTVISSDGFDAVLQPASTIRAGIMTKAMFDTLEAGAASYTENWK
jgi:hypothetical protein